ncbi:hypothetical protein ABIF13_003707 [Bradyrhizobium elkanii]
MGEEKITAFYDDPVKTACDAWSNAKAFSFREVSVGSGPTWQAQRWARFFGYLGRGWLRRLHNPAAAASTTRPANHFRQRPQAADRA